MSGPIVRWLRRHDPEWYALHKAIKVAVAVTAGLAIGTLIGNRQLSLFASFGSVALLLFADFPGSRAARFGAYLGLVTVGAALITLGTLASGIAWLAVLGMAVVGFVVLFAGVLSAAIAGATRAALLAFILPVTVPSTAADILPRLAGWGIAVLLTVPAAILVWPPGDHHKLRDRASEACAALAGLLTARSSPTTLSADPASSDAQGAILALRRQFRSTTFRPVGLTTGSRVLMQLTDRLEWLRAVADRIPVGAADRWPRRTINLVASCAEVLQASADVLADPAHRPSYATRQHLATALRDLEAHRAKVSAFLLVVTAGSATAVAGSAPAVAAGAAPPPDAAGESHLLRPSLAHELAYTVQLAGRTVAVSAAADARPLPDRLLGRRTPGSVEGPLAAAHRIAAGHITRSSVWFQNSLRGALGLTIAVFLAEITQIAHGFWVVLGAMSVLRTTALTTGSSALRALSGTLVGFVAGAVIMLVVGTTPWHLWLLLPFVVLVAAYLPEAVSFAAGQAAFTVMVVILFNIIEPTGWSVGLVRIEDIALGCAAGLISGVLLWPRGASAQIRAALAEYYRRSADALEEATGRLIRPTAAAGTLDDVMSSAKAAGFRLDDAFREYLFERGTKSVPVAELTAVANGASRVRLAAEAIAGMTTPRSLAQPTVPLNHEVSIVAPTGRSTDSGAGPPPGGVIAIAGTAVSASASSAATWFRQLAEVLGQGTKDNAPLPAVVPVQAEERVLDTFRAHPGGLTDPAEAAHGRTLWSASLYVDDVTRLQARLSRSVTALHEPGRAGSPPEINAADDADAHPAAAQDGTHDGATT